MDSVWLDMKDAPRDGKQFLMKLSNGWKVIASSPYNKAEFERQFEYYGIHMYGWWRTDGVSVPIEETHPPDTDWARGSPRRAIGWMHLPD